ncbi:DNA adenine methylase [Klebsiella michiganensis]
MTDLATMAIPTTHNRYIREKSQFERPIFKWAGGKFSVLQEVSKHLPHGARLIEPFVGGGSVFTNAGYKDNLLNDVNPDLINFYQVLSSQGTTLIELAQEFFCDHNNAKGYLDIREKFNNQEYTSLERAAAFLYLNRHCYNGLTRYNLAGGFNVGYGKFKHPLFPTEALFSFLFAQCTSTRTFMRGDFENVVNMAGASDVVFCDPPYEPLPDTMGFTSYSGTPFLFDSQERLTAALVAAHARGAKIVITNSGAPLIRSLYLDNGFTIHQLPTRRSVSCKSQTRNTAFDIIATLGAK